MGDAAGKDPVAPNPTGAPNLSDQTTLEMSDRYLMVFNGEPTVDDVASYTHGMIQAIYKAYSLGPSCTPYEIAVGDQTKKMASCLPRSEEHTSELQSLRHLVCRLLLEK